MGEERHQARRGCEERAHSLQRNQQKAAATFLEVQKVGSAFLKSSSLPLDDFACGSLSAFLQPAEVYAEMVSVTLRVGRK